MPEKIDVIEFLIRKGPDRTERELAEAMYGRSAYQQHVNQECRMLADKGKVERRGTGGPGDPFRYHPAAYS